VALTVHHAAAAADAELIIPYPASPRGGRCVDRAL